MSQRTAIFPGQGSQAVGMGRDVVAAWPAARRVFERAAEVLGRDLASVCFEGPPEALEATDVQQPAIFTTSVAVWEALRERSPSLCRFDSMAGLSLGEYTALHLAGALDFEDGLRLVQERGRLMQAAATARSGGMVSLMGADEPQVHELCREASDAGPIAPANLNCPGQIVVSGAKAACERIVALAEAAGLRAVPLKVAGAFHSPLMASAAEGLRAALAGVTIRRPRIPVIANVNGEPHRDPDTIRAWLVEQLVRPVRWQASIEYLIRAGSTEFVEIGPGRVLTGLMRRINRNVSATAVGDAAAVQKLEVSP